ncbi:hypothetical protein B1R32_11279 [Abditibacterium utsteinense]|uniref:Uncharacterized protein n=1 Tax=Abditibacterium utsteinense TaxID=1960156 RepID=A0A2S8SRJ0_9BACT|nr:hypothetical protein [Abditibacterium utsteinense]PQV63424.1 hypothetical protein B1R32_11279 [Abditibacterium utsteinense]
MSSGEITKGIERFIYDHINSVEQLEILLLVAAPPHKAWSAIEVSQKLYRQPDSVATRLEDLRDRGLLTISGQGQPLYQYVSDGRHDALIQGLERAYQVRKDAVIQLIFTRPSDNLRVFSDAFRIRKDN